MITQNTDGSWVKYFLSILIYVFIQLLVIFINASINISSQYFESSIGMKFDSTLKSWEHIDAFLPIEWMYIATNFWTLVYRYS